VPSQRGTILVRRADLARTIYDHLSILARIRFHVAQDARRAANPAITASGFSIKGHRDFSRTCRDPPTPRPTRPPPCSIIAIPRAIDPSSGLDRSAHSWISIVPRDLRRSTIPQTCREQISTDRGSEMSLRRLSERHVSALSRGFPAD
jgi:hypothetical protein